MASLAALATVMVVVACSDANDSMIHTGVAGTGGNGGDAGTGDNGGSGGTSSPTCMAGTGNCGVPSGGTGGGAGSGGSGNGGGNGGEGGMSAGGNGGMSAGGNGGEGGMLGCPFPFTGANCGSNNCMAGTGNCGVPPGGAGGTAGSAGRGGGGGTPGIGGMAGDDGATLLPQCTNGAVTFGVCFVSDADVLPLPAVILDDGTGTSGTATVENVGTGSAPASCENARWFGTHGTSEWWFQARAANNRLWTIGVHGLGAMQPIQKNDTVTLDLGWRGRTLGFAAPPTGQMQLSNAAGTPLLWAGAFMFQSATGWLKLAPGDPACRHYTNPCDFRRRNVAITVNGNVGTVAPYGVGVVGGYTVTAGELGDKLSAGAGPLSSCSPDYLGPPFDAAAAKVP